MEGMTLLLIVALGLNIGAVGTILIRRRTKEKRLKEEFGGE